MSLSEEEILAQVQNIFREVFNDNTLIITYSTTAADIEEWDSLEQINLLVAKEKHFNIKFDIDEVINLTNVGDMVRVIKNKINN